MGVRGVPLKAGLQEVPPDFRCSAAKRGVDEFDAISFCNHHGGKVFSVYVPAIQFHNDSGIILSGTIEQLLNRQAGFFHFFRKSVEQKLQGESSEEMLADDEIASAAYGMSKKHSGNTSCEEALPDCCFRTIRLLLGF